jgi:beta-glucanase (GH16 family)
MKILFHLISIFFLFSSCQKENIETPSHISSAYTLFWNDEFDSEDIDSSKWDYRATGNLRGFGLVSEDNSYLDNEGHLIIKVTKEDSIHKIGQVGTHNKFLTQYGYFECRAKMNNQRGPHVAFWLQSPTMGVEDDNPGVNGTEIDIFEYHTNKGTNIVYHNLHWNGYGESHKSAGTNVELIGLNTGFHTFGLEWTEDEYVFYVDGKETWRTTEAVSHRTEYIILSAELSGWGGEFKYSLFPDEVVFDYVRVYKKSN